LEKIETALPDVFLVRPKVFRDDRGFFFESYHREKFARLGISDNFVQDNHSRSRRGTVRGLHYQLSHPQAKLCRVVFGEVVDVAVDIRRGSPTFGKSVTVVLSAENQQQIYIPPGFAHGFAVLSESAEFLYKCSDFYYPEDEQGVLWNDPALKIDWRVSEALLSDKDKRFRPLSKIPVECLPKYSA
jgi:dTDP-4-dehydrorhamnose 3,5-epimerase